MTTPFFALPHENQGSTGTYFSEDSLLRQVLGSLNPEPVNLYDIDQPQKGLRFSASPLQAHTDRSFVILRLDRSWILVPGYWFLDTGSWILDFLDLVIKELLGIQHRVSSIQHQPVKCTHLSIPTMPAEKILCNVGANSMSATGAASKPRRGVA